jgi:hypothetical protein
MYIPIVKFNFVEENFFDLNNLFEQFEQKVKLTNIFQQILI